MMNLRLITHSTNLATTGKLYIKHDDCVQTDELLCSTFELPWRDNQPNISCIPAGVYPLKMTNSPKYGPCYKVYNVDGRTDILIHKGNYVRDTLGCILPVSSYGVSHDEFAGLSSKNAYDPLMARLAGENHTLTIERH